MSEITFGKVTIEVFLGVDRVSDELFNRLLELPFVSEFVGGGPHSDYIVCEIYDGLLGMGFKKQEIRAKLQGAISPCYRCGEWPAQHGLERDPLCDACDIELHGGDSYED